MYVCISYLMYILSTIWLLNSKGRHVTPALGHGLPSPQPSTFPRPLVLLQLCGGQSLCPQGHWLRPERAETRRHSGPLELWVPRIKERENTHKKTHILYLTFEQLLKERYVILQPSVSCKIDYTLKVKHEDKNRACLFVFLALLLKETIGGRS